MSRAAAHGGYSMAEFNDLPGVDDFIDPEQPTESKSTVIARYRIDQLLHAIEQDIVLTESERKGKKRH